MIIACHFRVKDNYTLPYLIIKHLSIFSQSQRCVCPRRSWNKKPCSSPTSPQILLYIFSSSLFLLCDSSPSVKLILCTSSTTRSRFVLQVRGKFTSNFSVIPNSPLRFQHSLQLQGKRWRKTPSNLENCILSFICYGFSGNCHSIFFVFLQHFMF